jgi:Putative  PD-(D/E)XK family member, (DUF4420)
VIDEVRMTFAALGGVVPSRSDELAVRSLPSAPPMVRLGIDGERHPHLLVPSDESQVSPSGSDAVSVAKRSLEIDGRVGAYLDVVCAAPALNEIFDHFVVAVVDHLERSQDPPSTIVARVVEEWRRLLAAIGPAFGVDRLAPLVGELLVLIDIVRADPARRVDVWTGPFGGRHDMRRGLSAIEVKTTRAHTGRIVTIHGEDQLLEPSDGTLHLHLVRLEHVSEGAVSASDLVEELIAIGAPARETLDAVARCGLSPAQLPSTSAVRFDVRERMTVPVDEGTPRIIARSFAGAATPSGIVDITYRIDLDQVTGRTLSDDEYRSLVGSIAVESARG